MNKPPKPMTETRGSYLPSSNQVPPPAPIKTNSKSDQTAPASPIKDLSQIIFKNCEVTCIDWRSYKKKKK